MLRVSIPPERFPGRPTEAEHESHRRQILRSPERESNAGEAKKMEALIKRYRDETGVDLKTLKPKEEKEGIIRSRLEKRLNQSNS